MNEFEKFINSPFFNNHSTIIKLFGELKKYYPDFENENLNKEYLFSVSGTKKKYDDRLFRKYLSRMNKLAEEYLNVLQMRLDKNRKELNILQQYYNKNILDVFEKKLNSVEKTIKNNRTLHSEYFHFLHQLNRLKFNYKATEDFMQPHNEELFKSSNYLLNYFLFEASAINSQIETNNYSFKISSEVNPLSGFLDISLIENNLNILTNRKSEGYKEIIIFLEAVKYDLNLNSPKHCLNAYNNLKKFVRKNSNTLSDEMLSYILQRMNIFCFIENIKGFNNRDKELFENYKMLLEKNLLNIEKTKTLSLLDFRSILFVSLKNNEFTWAQNFIAESLNIVKEEQKSDIKNYGNAIFLFYKKKYSDSLVSFSRIRSKSLPIVIDNYVFRLKLFYVLRYFDSASALADSFRHFIKANNVIGDFHKKTLNNFLKYFRKILACRIRDDQKNLIELHSELKKCSNTKEKNWMMEIIEEELNQT